MRSNQTLRALTEGAVTIAMALALMLLPLRFSIWPEGGSVDFVMVPLTVYALRRGAGAGVTAAAVYGLLDCILGGGVAYGWQAIILDYIVAYGVIGLAGLFPRLPALGAALGAAARLCIHVISGVVIWGEWMPESFLGLAMSSVLFYSLLYNATYMVPNGIITASASALLKNRSTLLDVQ